ncbi:MAG: secondary thiamine-phosphate synthase enzyme [Ignavibacteria bacterium GWA2_54_16]|nr:MAG: secondary thiamine-phosphate synthase enzyme [Ignavibacteria bacterium GWA2_54_16]
MAIITERLSISTNGGSEVLNITEAVSTILGKHKLQEGSLLVFVAGSTASVTTTEFEPGLRKDIPEVLNRLVPEKLRYHHDDTWGDGNGHSHVRASIMSPSLVIPFSRGELLIGTWQQVVLVDHDNRPRERTIVVQLSGE